MSFPEREIDAMAMLHRASTEEAVPDHVRARVWSAVNVALQASGTIAASAHAASPGDATSAAAQGSASPVGHAADAGNVVLARAGDGLRPWVSKFLHWSAPALVIGAAAGVTARDALVPAESRTVRTPPAVIAPKAVPSVAPSGSAAIEGPRPAVTAENTESPSAAPPAAEPSANPRVLAARELARERALLDQARAQIAAGEPARALEFVERHERRHAQGALAEEREALAVNALVSVGRYREAAQRGEAFRARYPNSLLMPSVEAALAAIPAK